MSFLLPREIRNEVYYYITDMIPHSFANYSGFYMSCRQVKEELDVEGAKNVKACLTKLTHSLDSDRKLLFKIPDTFREMRNPCLSLGINSYFLYWEDMENDATEEPIALVQQLFALYLDSITLTYHTELVEDRISSIDDHCIEWLRANALEGAQIAKGALHVRRLIIDLPPMHTSGIGSKLWKEKAHDSYALWKLQTWRSQEDNHGAVKTKAIYICTKTFGDKLRIVA